LHFTLNEAHFAASISYTSLSPPNRPQGSHPMAEHEAEPGTAAILAVSIAQQTIQRLAEKGLLSVEDGAAIYSGALDALRDEHKVEARTILKTLMPALTL
jgi:hypothetical protein